MGLEQGAYIGSGGAVGDVLDKDDAVRARWSAGSGRVEGGEINAVLLKECLRLLYDMCLREGEFHSSVVGLRVQNVRLGDVHTIRNR